MTAPRRAPVDPAFNTVMQGRTLEKLQKKEPSAKVVARVDGCPIVRVRDYYLGKPVYEWLRIRRQGGYEKTDNPNDYESLMQAS